MWEHLHIIRTRGPSRAKDAAPGQDPVQPAGHPEREHSVSSISGLVVEYIVAIDVTRVRFPADALLVCVCVCVCMFVFRQSGSEAKRAVTT